MPGCNSPKERISPSTPETNSSDSTGLVAKLRGFFGRTFGSEQKSEISETAAVDPIQVARQKLCEAFIGQTPNQFTPATETALQELADAYIAAGDLPDERSFISSLVNSRGYRAIRNGANEAWETAMKGLYRRLEDKVKTARNSAEGQANVARKLDNQAAESANGIKGTLAL